MLFSLYGHERAFEQLIEGVFNRYLNGRDPMNRDALNKTMYAGLSSQHTDYFIGGIISAFDIAMWDICGKALGVPVADLLGGRYRDQHPHIHLPLRHRRRRRSRRVGVELVEQSEARRRGRRQARRRGLHRR